MPVDWQYLTRGLDWLQGERALDKGGKSRVTTRTHIRANFRRFHPGCPHGPVKKPWRKSGLNLYTVEG